jgi:hypothetical protein
MPAAVISGESVFVARVMTGVASVASPIARLVAMEVVELLLIARRQRSSVPAAGIVPVVDMAVEFVGAVEPATGADENSAIEPIRAIVAIGRAVIGSVIEVPIRARGLHSDTERDLGWRHARAAEYGNRESCAS